MKANDLKPEHFPTLTWEPGKLADPLGKLCAYVARQAEEAIQWYQIKKRGARCWGRGFRLGAILLTALAGLIPVLSELLGEDFDLNPLWSAVSLALAGTLILLDRFYGCTSAWIRYIQAELELGEALNTFRIDCELEKQSWGELEPKPKQAEAMIAHSKKVLLEVHSIIRDETRIWAAEFQSVLRQVDEAAKAAERSRKMQREEGDRETR